MSEHVRSVKAIFTMSVLFGSTGTVSSDLYLPSLPAIAHSLHASISMAQFSVAMFVLGFSVSRLLLGVISDAVGRKIPLVISLFICLIGCLCCLFAKGISFFLLGRIFQGFGAGGSNVLGRVILRDRVGGAKLAEYSSYYSMAGITLMAAAPLGGGYLQHYFGWHASFIVLLFYTSFALFISLFVLQETNKYKHKDFLKLSILKENSRILFLNKPFMIYALLLLLGYGTMIAWLTSGPIVLQKVMGLTPIEFGWCAALVGLCYFISAYLNSKFVGKVGIQKMLQFGISCFFIATVIMIIPPLFFHYISTAILVGPVMLAIFGMGMVMPNSYAAGLTPFAKMAGIAVAILGSVQILGGFIASTIISISPDHNQLPVSLVMFVCAILCLFLVKILKRTAVQPINF